MPILKIVQDTDPADPRKEFDNLSLFVCAETNHSIGDKNSKATLFEKLGIIDHNLKNIDLANKAKSKGLVFYSVPVYIYEHGNICLSTTPFSCPFDSYQIGEILVFKDKIKEEFSVKRFTKKVTEELTEKIALVIENEVSIYSDFLSGDVYGFQVIEDDESVSDSCYGFYGSDFKNNGIKDQLSPEMQEKLLKGDYVNE